MKKILFSILLSGLCFKGFSQTVKARIDTGATKRTVKIYLKPDVTQAPATISTLQFNIGVDTTALPVAPTLAVISTGTGFGTPANWTPAVGYKEGAYWQYNIFTSVSPLTPSFTANTEILVMELQFDNGDVLGLSYDTTKAALVTLPDGGASGGALFYCTGTIASDGLSNLYYGPSVINVNSYDPSGATAGTGTSIAPIPTVIVPVRFLNFNVTKSSNNSALVNWSVENEDANTASYEIQLSTNGANFNTVVATLNPANNGRASNTYSFTQTNISSILNSGALYYRIKQTDRDGRAVYTEIKSIRLSGKSFIVNAYPNPVRDITTITLDLVEDAKVSILINDAAGKQVQAIQMTGFKGFNTKAIDMSKFASGSYMLKVQAGAEIKTIPVVKTK